MGGTFSAPPVQNDLNRLTDAERMFRQSFLSPRTTAWHAENRGFSDIGSCGNGYKTRLHAIGIVLAVESTVTLSITLPGCALQVKRTGKMEQ
jgi:hypothetical protein